MVADLRCVGCYEGRGVKGGAVELDAQLKDGHLSVARMLQPCSNERSGVLCVRRVKKAYDMSRLE